MLWKILVILLVIWLMGFIADVGEGIHLLLLVAGVILVINMWRGRRFI